MALHDLKDVFHRIRVKLYPNYLPQIEGEYLARTVNEKTLSVEDVCAELKLRGGFTGSYNDLVEHVKMYHDEAAYQLCDGFAVNTGYYSIHPNVGGTFDKLREGLTPEKHPIDFRFRINAALHDLTDRIEVYVEGLADTGAFIDEFTDLKTGLVNQRATKGGQFILSGSKIKVAGTSAKIGVFFTAPGSPIVSIKVSEVLAVNDPHRIIGIIPELLPDKLWRVEVQTQYSNGSTLLKKLRTIESPFTVTQD
jgi:hypothetical protein